MTKASGCLFGLAYGDALGKPTEFLRYSDIEQRYGRGGPRELTGDPALVTYSDQSGSARLTPRNDPHQSSTPR